jgi:hypothetical protein
MLKAMTMSLAAGTLLLGLASAALASTSAHVRARHAEHHTNMLDPAPRGLLGMDCTINGTYHDWPYCFGSDHPSGTRIGAPIQTRGGY